MKSRKDEAEPRDPQERGPMPPPAQDDPPAHDQAVEEPCPETQDLLGIPEPEEAPGMRREDRSRNNSDRHEGKTDGDDPERKLVQRLERGRRRVQPVMRFALRARSWKR